MDDSRMHLLTVLYALHMPVILAACHLLLCMQLDALAYRLVDITCKQKWCIRGICMQSTVGAI